MNIFKLSKTIMAIANCNFSAFHNNFYEYNKLICNYLMV